MNNVVGSWPSEAPWWMSRVCNKVRAHTSRDLAHEAIDACQSNLRPPRSRLHQGTIPVQTLVETDNSPGRLTQSQRRGNRPSSPDSSDSSDFARCSTFSRPSFQSRHAARDITRQHADISAKTERGWSRLLLRSGTGLAPLVPCTVLYFLQARGFRVIAISTSIFSFC